MKFVSGKQQVVSGRECSSHVVQGTLQSSSGLLAAPYSQELEAMAPTTDDRNDMRGTPFGLSQATMGRILTFGCGNIFQVAGRHSRHALLEPMQTLRQHTSGTFSFEPRTKQDHE